MKSKLLNCILAVFLLTSCVSGLNTDQKRKLRAVKAQMPEHYVQEKNEGAALALGLLPGGGSFYTRNYVIGAVDLIFWPLSILWDPFNGINGAEEINYYATVDALKRNKNKEISALDDKLANKQVSQDEYNLAVRKVEKKYDMENML